MCQIWPVRPLPQIPPDQSANHSVHHGNWTSPSRVHENWRFIHHGPAEEGSD